MTSSASRRRTAAPSFSFIIRGQSFSRRVISATIASLSGVGSGVATAWLVVLALLLFVCAQPAAIAIETIATNKNVNFVILITTTPFCITSTDDLTTMVGSSRR